MSYSSFVLFGKGKETHVTSFFSLQIHAKLWQIYVLSFYLYFDQSSASNWCHDKTSALNFERSFKITQFNFKIFVNFEILTKVKLYFLDKSLLSKPNQTWVGIFTCQDHINMWASQWMTDKIRQWSNESGLPTPQEFKTPTWKRVHTWFSMEHLLQPAWPQEPTGQWRHFMTSIHCWRKYFEKKGFSTIGVFDVWVFSIFNTYFSQIWDILSPLLWVCEMCCCTWRDNGRVNKVHYRWADLAAGSSFPKGPALPWKPVWPTYNCHTSIFSAASF